MQSLARETLSAAGWPRKIAMTSIDGLVGCIGMGRLRQLNQAGEQISKLGAVRPAEGKIDFAVERVELVVDAHRGTLGLKCFIEGTHMIFMRLRGIFGIFAFAVEGILGDRGSEQPTLAVNDGNANAQCSKIRSSNDRHARSPVMSFALACFAAARRIRFFVRAQILRSKPSRK